MGYGLIPVIVSVGLVFHHVFFTDTSGASKVAVTGAVLASFLIPEVLPRWSLAGTFLQVAASIYMIVYWKLQTATAG